jgi:hypothetical protein
VALAGNTEAFVINEKGAVVGFYLDAGFVNHGFLDVGGVFTTIDDPDSTPPIGTVAMGINASLHGA